MLNTRQGFGFLCGELHTYSTTKYESVTLNIALIYYFDTTLKYARKHVKNYCLNNYFVLAQTETLVSAAAAAAVVELVVVVVVVVVVAASM
jgi:7-keto-8-aminopelargonate synthetase-like enzyme